MSTIDLSGCGRSILISMIHDLQKRVQELEAPGIIDPHILLAAVLDLKDEATNISDEQIKDPYWAGRKDALLYALRILAKAEVKDD